MFAASDHAGRSALAKAGYRIDGLAIAPSREAARTASNINFAIEPGTALIVMGASGCGKSLLLRMLAGLQAPASGSIRLGDLKLPDLDAKLRDRLIGHVPQDSVFLPGPLADAVARYDLEIGMVAVITACKRVEIHEAIMAMPKAYDTVLPPQGAPLPFGLMRRLALARAICRKPHVLVLDDPLIGLDAGSLKMLTRLIAEQKASGGISSNMATRSCSSSRSTSDHSRPSTRT